MKLWQNSRWHTFSDHSVHRRKKSRAEKFLLSLKQSSGVFRNLKRGSRVYTFQVCIFKIVQMFAYFLHIKIVQNFFASKGPHKYAPETEQYTRRLTKSACLTTDSSSTACQRANWKRRRIDYKITGLHCVRLHHRALFSLLYRTGINYDVCTAQCTLAHKSAYARSWDRMSSVRLSVRLWRWWIVIT